MATLGVVIKTAGIDELKNKISAVKQRSYDTEINRNLREMYDRAEYPPYTPVKSGKLRDSRRIVYSQNGSGGEFTYDTHYAALVEYGHDSKSGRFVPARYYLHRNMQLQESKFTQDILKYFWDTKDYYK